MRENGLGDGEAVVYVQVTRGAAQRTHHFPPAGTRPTVYVAASRFAPPHDLRTRGVAVITLPDVRWARCDIKSVNLLANVLAKQEAVARGAFEAVFVRDGVVTEGAQTTVFAVAGGALRTHPRGPYLLPGVTREVLLEFAAAEGIAIDESPVRADELAGAAEVFVASTTADVMPVVAVDGRPVGDGRPGPVTRRLYGRLALAMSHGNECAPA